MYTQEWYKRLENFGIFYSKVANREDQRSPVYMYTRMIVPLATYNFLKVLQEFENFVPGEKLQKLRMMEEAEFRKIIKIIVSFHTIHFLTKVKENNQLGMDLINFEKKILSCIYFDEEERQYYGRSKTYLNENKEKSLMYVMHWLFEKLDLLHEQNANQLAQIVMHYLHYYQEHFVTGFVFWSSRTERTKKPAPSNYVINYYEVLGLHIKASKEDIVKQYRLLIKQYHPDVYKGENKEEALQIFYKIRESYEVLSDDEKRKEYDEQISQINNLFNTTIE